MKHKKLTVFFAVAVFLLAWSAAQAYELFLGPTGLVRYDKAKAFNGYILYAPYTSKDIYLIDMEGNVVNKWETPYLPGLHAMLLDNGNILTAAQDPAGMVVNFGGSGGIVRELTWDNKEVWSYKSNSPKGIQHHTFDRMPNGNTLVLQWEQKSWEEAIKKGRDIKKTFPFGVRNPNNPSAVIHGIWPDFIQEVDKSGKVVWEWHAWDHVGVGPDKLDINYSIPGLGPIYAGPDWSHFNTVQYVAKTDQIILNSRNLGEFYIIDHKTGKMMYRWGNPAQAGRGRHPGGYIDDGDQILFGPHHAQMLPNGNISVFDNGTMRPSGNYSRVVEMDPRTDKIVWEFAAKGAPRQGNSFYSAFQCGAQLLPNGNYFVTVTAPGHMFQVTRDKQIVWEYVNPIGAKGAVCAVDDNAPDVSVHRALMYAADHPGLKGKDLTPKGKISPCGDFRQFMEAAAAKK